jgi:multidrug efflux pump subunit AcrA (membrane-fusion protein)
MPELITNPTDLNLNERDEILQFIGRPPSVFLRFGIMAVAIVVVLLLTMSYWIKYPDVVTAKVVLMTENPPIHVFAQAGGRVSNILIKNNENVKEGQVLAIMNNTARWQDVLLLERELEQNNGVQISKTLELGALQGIYSTFTQNEKDFQYFQNKNGVAQKIAYLNQQIEATQQLNNNLLKQKEFQVKEFALSEKELNRQNQLHTEGVISDAEFEKFNSQYLQQKRQLEAIEATFINNQMQIQQHQAQISDLTQGKSDNQNTKELTLQEDINRLKSAIADWKQQYLIIAPISGKVTLSKIWSSQQNINSGDEFLAIVPDNSQNQVICKATLPIAQAGKVKLGLITNIRIDAFPYQQYGILKGEVSNIALVPQKEDYQLDIKLQNGMNTSYGKTLNFRQEMQGSANIITEDRRVIERVLDRFRDLVWNR